MNTHPSHITAIPSVFINRESQVNNIPQILKSGKIFIQLDTMENRIVHRSSTREYASFNAFERACLEGRISSMGYGYIAIPPLKRLAWEEDEVMRRIHGILASFAFPPLHVVFGSASLNLFINQLIAHPSYVVEVGKEYLQPCFDALRGALRNRVLLNPSEEERVRYYEPGIVCLYPLMSKAPVSKDGEARVEKLLVDLITSPRYRSLYSGSDIAQALSILANDYAVNYRTLFAYASRKRKTTEVYMALEDVALGQTKEMLHAIKEEL